MRDAGLAMRLRIVLPYVLGVVLAATGVQLGQWQLRRAGEKATLQAQLDQMASRPPSLLSDRQNPEAWQPVVLKGQWLPGADFLIDNRVYNGRPGFHVVSALTLDDGRVVLVNRGWTPARSNRSDLPRVPPPDGAARVEGVVHYPEARPFRLAADPAEGHLRQHLVAEEIGAAIGRAVMPWVVLQAPEAAEPLVRDWPRPDAGIDRHRGYAVQWFGLATLAAGLTGFFGWRQFFRGRQA